MFNYILYRIGKFIALALPIKFGYWLAVTLSDLRYHSIFIASVRNDREAVTGNLKAIFPEKSDLEIGRIRIKMFRNFAKYLVDFFRFSLIDQAYIKKHISIEGLDYYEQALAKGKGVIVLTAHLGNWELGGVVIALSGYPLWVVALPHKNKLVDEFFTNQRKDKGIHVMHLGKAVRKCLSLLGDNKMVALVGDRDFSESRIEVDFFGKRSYLPPGPAAFALKTGAVIVPGFLVRNDDDSFTLRILKPIEPVLSDKPSGADYKNERLLEIINSYKCIIEEYIKKFPEQWYMFRKFWIS